MFSRIVVLLSVITFACAATMMGRLPQIPTELAHKKGCYIQDINDVLPFGEEFTPSDSCVRISCTYRMIYYDTCGVQMTDDPETVTEADLSKPYPDCCPTLKVDLDNNII